MSGAAAGHDDKQAHEAEAFAVVDRGTSYLVNLQANDRYEAQNTLLAMTSTLLRQGLPHRIVFDRDPRFVGSWTRGDFPSVFMRFLMTLGIAVDICPPRRPGLKPFVERYFRTLNSEVVAVHHPGNAAEASTVFEAHRLTYNLERPNQSTACNNRPPAVAFPTLPVLPRLPGQVDPDRWLQRYHGRVFTRRVTHNGSIQIDKHRYYIQRALQGRRVACQLDAHRQVFDVLLDRQVFKSMPIKGLYGAPLPFETYLDLMLKDAEAEARRLAPRATTRRAPM